MWYNIIYQGRWESSLKLFTFLVIRVTKTTTTVVKRMIDDNQLMNELAKNPDFINEEGAGSDQPEVPEEPQGPEEPQQETADVEDEGETMEEVLGLKEEAEAESEETVPLATFLEMKKELSDLKKQNLSSSERDASIEAIANEYDVDLVFANKLADAITAKATKEVQKQYEPLVQKQKQAETDKMFDSVYGKAIESMPEYAGIANKDVVKKLALDPSNKKKTVKQIMKEVYGSVVDRIDAQPGQSFEAPRAKNRNVNDLDFGNLSAEDHDLIASDPKLRAQYGDWMVKNMNL